MASLILLAFFAILLFLLVGLGAWILALELLLIAELREFRVVHRVLDERLKRFTQNHHRVDDLALELPERRMVRHGDVEVAAEVRFQQLVRLLAGVFELALLKFEKRSLVLLEVARVVVGHVGPLQHLPAGDYLLRAFLKELELHHRVLLDLMQFLHILPDLFYLLFGDVPRLGMVHVPLEVVHVSLQLIFRVLLILQHFREVFILLGFLLVHVASVVSARGTAMLAPIREAEPAKVVSAIAARHVIAALVLLDKALALRARFRVRFDPGHVLAGVLLLEEPERNLVAGGRLMVFLLALEAEGASAEAVDHIYHAEGAELHDVLARLHGTPLHTFIEIGELLAVPVDVLAVVVDAVVVDFVLQVFQEERVRHHQIAPRIGAFCKYALRAVALDFILEVHLPTYLAKLVAAAQLVRVVIWIALLELHVHHLAHVTIVFFSCSIYVGVLFHELLVVLEAD